MLPDNPDLFLQTLWLAIGDSAALLWQWLWMGAVFQYAYRFWDSTLGDWVFGKRKNKND